MRALAFDARSSSRSAEARKSALEPLRFIRLQFDLPLSRRSESDCPRLRPVAIGEAGRAGWTRDDRVAAESKRRGSVSSKPGRRERRLRAPCDCDLLHRWRDARQVADGADGGHGFPRQSAEAADSIIPRTSAAELAFASRPRRNRSEHLASIAAQTVSVRAQVVLHPELLRRIRGAHVADRAEDRPFRTPRPVVAAQRPAIAEYEFGSRPSSAWRFMSRVIMWSASRGEAVHSRIFFPHNMRR